MSDDSLIASLDPAAWASLRGKECGWGRLDVQKTAAALVEQPPAGVIEKVKAGVEWKGQQLISLKDEPDVKAVVQNAVWLTAFLQAYDARVAPVYCIADVLLWIDEHNCSGKLLNATLHKSKEVIALQQAGEVKKLISYLRYLWRASAKSRNRTVQILAKKPKPAVAGAPAAALEDAPVEAGETCDDAMNDLDQTALCDLPDDDAMNDLETALRDLPDSVEAFIEMFACEPEETDGVEATLQSDGGQSVNTDDDTLFMGAMSAMGLHDLGVEPLGLNCQTAEETAAAIEGAPCAKKPKYADDVMEFVSGLPLPSVDPLEPKRELRKQRLQKNIDKAN
ncbi:unnamed protein product, partial [Prorocentrum cordatum]